MTKIELPPIVKKFIDEKVICMEIPLLPCLYQNFEKMQEGYRYDPIKQCLLITDKPRSWGNSWYVIAQNALGDPFFVDINEENYPVYTAKHGMRGWKPIKISESIFQFFEILNKITNMNLTFPCSLSFLSDIIDLDNEFWMEVNEFCQEDE